MYVCIYIYINIYIYIYYIVKLLVQALRTRVSASLPPSLPASLSRPLPQPMSAYAALRYSICATRAEQGALQYKLTRTGRRCVREGAALYCTVMHAMLCKYIAALTRESRAGWRFSRPCIVRPCIEHPLYCSARTVRTCSHAVACPGPPLLGLTAGGLQHIADFYVNVEVSNQRARKGVADSYLNLEIEARYILQALLSRTAPAWSILLLLLLLLLLIIIIISVCVYISLSLYIYIYVCIHTYIFMYIYMYIFIHTCTHV